MSKLQTFNKLRQDLDALFSSKVNIERKICEKANQLYKLNSECISLSKNETKNNENIESLCFEICKYVSEVLQIRLKQDGLKEIKFSVIKDNIERSEVTNSNKCEIENSKNLISENIQTENKKSLINTNSYAFQNIYKLDDIMNTTNWLWNKELKSKIVEVASNKNRSLTPVVTKCPHVSMNYSATIQSYNKKQYNALPKLVSKTVTIEQKIHEKEVSKNLNPLKSYIQKAFRFGA